jgi:hypothetical protein
MPHDRNHRRPDAALTLAKGLGWFSIGLGLAELLVPRRFTEALGIRGDENLVRAYGVREIATGIGILASRDPTPWIYGRIGGDALDLVTLAAAAKGAGERRDNVGVALAAVAGVTALDVACAALLSAESEADRGDQERMMRDYGRRSGFPFPPSAMRGAAVGGREGGGFPHRAFGVAVTQEGEPRSRPLVVVARDEIEAELMAAEAAGGRANTRIVRELTETEAAEYGLDLTHHGQAKALPALNL